MATDTKYVIVIYADVPDDYAYGTDNGYGPTVPELVAKCIGPFDTMDAARSYRAEHPEGEWDVLEVVSR